MECRRRFQYVCTVCVVTFCTKVGFFSVGGRYTYSQVVIHSRYNWLTHWWNMPHHLYNHWVCHKTPSKILFFIVATCNMLISSLVWVPTDALNVNRAWIERQNCIIPWYDLSFTKRDLKFALRLMNKWSAISGIIDQLSLYVALLVTLIRDDQSAAGRANISKWHLTCNTTARFTWTFVQHGYTMCHAWMLIDKA